MNQTVTMPNEVITTPRGRWAHIRGAASLTDAARRYLGQAVDAAFDQFDEVAGPTTQGGPRQVIQTET